MITARKYHMVEDGNLQLGSEESMIRCHLMLNGKSRISWYCGDWKIFTIHVETQFSASDIAKRFLNATWGIELQCKVGLNSRHWSWEFWLFGTGVLTCYL